MKVYLFFFVLSLIVALFFDVVGKLPASQANPEVVTAFRNTEWEETRKLLHNYLRICNTAKVFFLFELVVLGDFSEV